MHVEWVQGSQRFVQRIGRTDLCDDELNYDIYLTGGGDNRRSKRKAIVGCEGSDIVMSQERRILFSQKQENCIIL